MIRIVVQLFIVHFQLLTGLGSSRRSERQTRCGTLPQHPTHQRTHLSTRPNTYQWI